MPRSTFTQQTIDGSTIEFTVTPGTIGNTTGGYVLAGIVGFYLAFAGANQDGGSVIQLLLGILAGYGVHRGIVYWRTHKADRMRSPGGSFRASPEGLELHSGERIPRADIEDLLTMDLMQTLPSCHMLVVDAKEHDLSTLAGGMDQATAAALAAAVKAQLQMT